MYSRNHEEKGYVVFYGNGSESNPTLWELFVQDMYCHSAAILRGEISATDIWNVPMD